MFINHTTRTVQVTKKFMKAAGNLHSHECQMIMELRKCFPDYSIVVKGTPSAAPNLYRGLTYEFMLNYIQKQTESVALMEEFQALRTINNAYPTIKKWFLLRFPEFTNTAA